LVEQLICNQPVASSSLVTSFQEKQTFCAMDKAFSVTISAGYTSLVGTFWASLGQFGAKIEINN
jgi:hypothetical protein